MSSLTENERLGLEEVFLSISGNRHKEKWGFLKRTGRWFRLEKNSFYYAAKAHSGLSQMKKRLKLPYFIHQFAKSVKKKKNLS